MENANKLLSVVVPVYNEVAVLDEFHGRLVAALDALDCDTEIIYVDDGSEDGSVDLVLAMRDEDAKVGLIDLTIFLVGLQTG